jgi:TolA-binding protein
MVSADEKEPAKAKPAKTAKSLDQQLLDDLDSGLPDTPDIPRPKGDKEPPAKKQADELDGQLKKDLGDGEDIELGKPEDPLAKIGERMRKAERLIGQRNTSVKTQAIQREILTDLEALIDRLEKQRQMAGGGKQPSKPSTNSSPAKKPGPSTADSEQDSNKPAEESTERLSKTGDAEVDARDLHELVRGVWGNLPPRVRQQMQNAAVEQFLPKYEKLIEEYYKRLAEDKGIEN